MHMVYQIGRRYDHRCNFVQLLALIVAHYPQVEGWDSRHPNCSFSPLNVPGAPHIPGKHHNTTTLRNNIVKSFQVMLSIIMTWNVLPCLAII